MAGKSHKTSKEYVEALRRYVAQEQKSLLQQAYEVGRKAAADGMGVSKAVQYLRNKFAREEKSRMLQKAETFLMKALSPFETEPKLAELNEKLTRQNLKLAELNRDLQKKIDEGRRTEAALRESEEHFRVLFNSARLMEQNLRRLSNQMLHVQEEERQRISRELHDEVGQALTAIHIDLAILRKEAPRGKLFRKKIADAQALLVQTMETVHHFSRELRPAMLDDLGLVAALRSYVKAFQKRTAVRVGFRAWTGVERLNREQKTVLYRVVQESLTNVAKHAKASRVTLAIRAFENGIRMEVKDNGKAFPIEQPIIARDRKGLGLLGMQERVRLVNGECVIESQPGQGTIVRVQIPFQIGPLDPHAKAIAPAPPARGRKTQTEKEHHRSPTHSV